jgi:glyceraldehyde 3-phosphate dehydrogenase
MINIGINGLGRIGRVLLRQILNSHKFKLVAVNDINSDINNIAYLIKYDSTYGRLKASVSVKGKYIHIGKNKIKFSNKDEIDKVNWKNSKIDFLIDSSGVKKNLVLSRNLKNKVKNIIVTNSPGSKYVDKTMIYGVNDNDFDQSKDFLISSSICDATALAPILKITDKLFIIKKGFVTTLHPWLGYQNLLDGPSKSYAVPGEIIDNYALGRASPNVLIPKNTSAIKATYEVLPNLKNKFIANSFRIPTSIVSSADVVLELKKVPSQDKLIKEINNYKPKIISLNKEALVSHDFLQTQSSCFLDLRFLKILDNHLKFTLWYDNEWGYSSKVLDLIKKINTQ